MNFSNYLRDTFDFANSVEFKRCCPRDGSKPYGVEPNEQCKKGLPCPTKKSDEEKIKKTIKKSVSEAFIQNLINRDKAYNPYLQTR